MSDKLQALREHILKQQKDFAAYLKFYLDEYRQLALQDYANRKAGELICEHLELKATLTAFGEATKDAAKTFSDMQAVIADRLLSILNQDGVNSLKTDHGTAYKTTLLNQKIINREKFLDCVLDEENWLAFGGAMLLVSAQQDAVKEYMEAHNGTPPPGLEISWFQRLNIRKS